MCSCFTEGLENVCRLISNLWTRSQVAPKLMFSFKTEETSTQSNGSVAIKAVCIIVDGTGKAASVQQSLSERAIHVDTPQAQPLGRDFSHDGKTKRDHCP